ncbi:MAG: helicase-related protein [Acidimicrobiales bacterium]
MSFAVGSLVSARGRDWVVLPDSSDDFVKLRPLGGTDAEIAGILTALEEVRPATFDPPDPTKHGGDRSARLLRDALRLGFRSSAGPFRSFANLGVEPRPYQLVPLLMALRMDPVRLLIADDVGIGKTVESALIARELLDSGVAKRLCVLCPPHLAEQWQGELHDKFRIDAEVVLASTASRLERNLPVGRTIFDEHPYVIVSTDFIKADRRRDDFLRTCPELVIVDEAHTCAAEPGSRGARHQRHELVKGLADDPDRHLILVTATPHSGKEGAFRSLLTLLDPEFATLPDDLSGDHNRRHRERLARHLVQRRRADIRAYLDADTEFADRLETEATYNLSPEYRALFSKVLAYARESVRDESAGRQRQRVRWWSALALLRSLASSPAAASATLRTRAAAAGTSTPEEADEVGSRLVFDQGDDEDAEASDVVAGADDTEDADDSDSAKVRRRLQAMARDAEALKGDNDPKLAQVVKLVKQLQSHGSNPIIFCRFIPTAEYVAEELRSRLRGTEVVAVTGTLPPSAREERILELADHPKRVLVATDCLSEGVNLQDHFDAVLHYDLPWNPTRLEQREGRVDRFGQRAPEVRIVTFYGADNQIDDVVLDVLLRKHRTIRNSLGVSIPVPGNSNSVMEAVTESLLQADTEIQETLPGLDEFLKPSTEQLLLDWDAAAAREQRSRSLFAQHGIQPDEVAGELAEIRAAVGRGSDVERFVRDGVASLGGLASSEPHPLIDLTEASRAVREAVHVEAPFTASFSFPPRGNGVFLERTSPFVAGLAGFLLDAALDPQVTAPAARCGVVATRAVAEVTTVLLVRYRFHLVTRRKGEVIPLLAEDTGLLAFTGLPDEPAWLEPDEAEALLALTPDDNVSHARSEFFLSAVVDELGQLQAHADEEAGRRAEALEASHARVREALSERGTKTTVSAQLPADILGVYCYVPAGGQV